MGKFVTFGKEEEDEEEDETEEEDNNEDDKKLEETRTRDFLRKFDVFPKFVDVDFYSRSFGGGIITVVTYTSSPSRSFSRKRSCTSKRT